LWDNKKQRKGKERKKKMKKIIFFVMMMGVGSVWGMDEAKASKLDVFKNKMKFLQESLEDPQQPQPEYIKIPGVHEIKIDQIQKKKSRELTANYCVHAAEKINDRIKDKSSFDTYKKEITITEQVTSFKKDEVKHVNFKNSIIKKKTILTVGNTFVFDEVNVNSNIQNDAKGFFDDTKKYPFADLKSISSNNKDLIPTYIFVDCRKGGLSSEKAYILIVVYLYNIFVINPYIIESHYINPILKNLIPQIKGILTGFKDSVKKIVEEGEFESVVNLYTLFKENFPANKNRILECKTCHAFHENIPTHDNATQKETICNNNRKLLKKALEDNIVKKIEENIQNKKEQQQPANKNEVKTDIQATIKKVQQQLLITRIKKKILKEKMEAVAEK
jgi:hypothetical protein